MGKRAWILLICICTLLSLLGGTYCALRFGLGIDIFDQSGWQTQDGQTRYLDYFGRPVTRWHTVDGHTYYFDPASAILHTGWLELDHNRYFLDSDGLHTGWLEQDDKLFYMDDQGILQTGWLTENNTLYYLDPSGDPINGWMDHGSSRCYLRQSIAQSGWLEQPEGRYYLSGDGTPLTGWLNEGGNKYYLDSNGLMRTGWAEISEKQFYFQETGAMHVGWLETDTDRYYFRSDGTMAVGQVEIDGRVHFFTSTGKEFLLVNKWHAMPENYMPELVELNGFEIAASCRDALEQMILDCRKAGNRCSINNTYRSLERQQKMWDDRIDMWLSRGMTYDEAVERIGQSLAPVGASEHHLGLAADINGSDGMYVWLAEHCWEYGFILRYPEDKTDITGIIYEPWHFRYVGTELSTELQQLGLCLEEYVQQLTSHS